MDDELDSLVQLVMAVNDMSVEELRAYGASPVVVAGEPSEGWPKWCTGFVSMAPRVAVQAHQDVLAVMVTMMVAKQMGLVAGGPNIDLHQAATVTACAAEHGIRPQLNPETIRRILKKQRRAAGQTDGPLPGGAGQRLSPN